MTSAHSFSMEDALVIISNCEGMSGWQSSIIQENLNMKQQQFHLQTELTSWILNKRALTNELM